MHDAHKRRTSNILLYTGVPSHELHKYTHRSYPAFHNYILCRTDFHALLMNNFEPWVLRIESTAVHR